MEANSELFSRLEDLIERSDRDGTVTHTLFLTPKEQYQAENWLRGRRFQRFITGSGVDNTERSVILFYPEWMEKDEVSFDGYVSGVSIKVGFGEPGHRDYLGSIMGLGIKREWIGDILINGSEGYVICLNSVQETLVSELTHIARFGVKTSPVTVSDIPSKKLEVREKSFTVMSLRLDSITASAFNISRGKAAQFIEEGFVSLNYDECLKPSTEIKEKDIISVRGLGKGIVREIKGLSRKGRTIVDFSLYT